jgi:hypothetical protein
MNERIRKLALETDVWCDQNWAGHEFYNIKWEEKFAELIISSVMAEVRDEVQYQSGWTLADIVTERVKKEFGVTQ